LLPKLFAVILMASSPSPALLSLHALVSRATRRRGPVHLIFHDGDASPASGRVSRRQGISIEVNQQSISMSS
jgi:hypothetical protein